MAYPLGLLENTSLFLYPSISRSISFHLKVTKMHDYFSDEHATPKKLSTSCIPLQNKLLHLMGSSSLSFTLKFTPGTNKQKGSMVKTD